MLDRRIGLRVHRLERVADRARDRGLVEPEPLRLVVQRLAVLLHEGDRRVAGERARALEAAGFAVEFGGAGPAPVIWGGLLLLAMLLTIYAIRRTRTLIAEPIAALTTLMSRLANHDDDIDVPEFLRD